MTSREALELLVYGLTNDNYKKEDLGYTISRLREIITNDLEILDILKDLIFMGRCEILYTPDKQYITLQFIGTDYEEQARIDEKEYKQIELIKEWLNDQQTGVKNNETHNS